MPVRGVRRRYLAVFIDSELAPAGAAVIAEVQGSVGRLYGLKGQSEVDPVLTSYDEQARSGILRCMHLGERRLRAALAMITRVGGTPAAVRVTRSSGTIKALRRKTLQPKPPKTAD